ncbi:hypothetical protein EON65_54915 [archaeon]|nr:MAG: hypothetical protein EON65_54915 [archaeon]
MALSWSLFPLSNEFILFLTCSALGYFLYTEYHTKPRIKPTRLSTIRTYSSRARSLLTPPYLSSSAPRVTLSFDLLSLQRYIPKPTFQFSSVADETTRNSVVRKPSPVRVIARTESNDTSAMVKTGMDMGMFLAFIMVCEFCI